MTSRTKYAAALSLSLAAGFAIGWVSRECVSDCRKSTVGAEHRAARSNGAHISDDRLCGSLCSGDTGDRAQPLKNGVAPAGSSIVAELREEEARLAKEIAEIERGASGESKDNVGSLVAGYTFNGAKTLGEARVKAPQDYEDFDIVRHYRKACWGRGASKLREMMDKSGIDLSRLPEKERAAIVRLLEIKDRLAEAVCKAAAMGDDTTTEEVVHAESEIMSLQEEMGRVYESARNSLISLLVKARAEKAGFSNEDADSIAESFRAIAETDMQVY